MDASKKGREITLFWVPAHSSISSNESAVLTALKGYKSNFRIHYEDLLIESSVQANKLSVEYMKEVSITKGTLYFEHFYTSSTKT